MRIPELRIGSLTAPIPIVQGGMGVRVSRFRLAAAVTNQGGIGTLSSIGLGDIEQSKTDYEAVSRAALVEEIRRAKALTSGPLAVNVMGVLSNALDMVKAAAAEGVRMIVFGAGLPMKLPKIVEDPSVNLVPIISSVRVADLILRTWDKHYGRTVDAFILEGPLAGGHLGFSEDQLSNLQEHSLEKILPQVLTAVRPFSDKYQKPIPVVVAGGIFTGKDICRMLALGAAGVQMATRFVCTEECDVSAEYKQAYLNAREEDIVIIHSPVGMPARAIRTEFLVKLAGDEKPIIRCPYHCLTTCKRDNAKYCIAKALLNSYYGNVKEGIVFCGQNAYRVKRMYTVPELFAELIAEMKAEPEPA